MMEYVPTARDKAIYRVYILRCPLTGQPKYVGATRLSLRQRLMGHLTEFGNPIKKQWIDSLQKKNELPIIELQCKVKGFWGARKKEKKLIASLSKKYVLCNIKDNPAKPRIPSKYIIDALPKKQVA